MQSKLSVVEYTFEMVNDEMVLYTKSNNKIMILNRTAVFVLHELEKLIKNDDEIVVENTNKIVVVENDKIESAGEHKYLLKNSTRYRTLVQYPQLTSEDEY